MLVFGRIILHKRQASAMNSGAVSVSELSTTVDAMTKLQSSDTIVVTSLNGADDDAGDATKTKDGLNGGGGGKKIALNDVADKMGNDSIASDIDLKAPLSIPSISNRNNVSFCFFPSSSIRVSIQQIDRFVFCLSSVFRAATAFIQYLYT